MLQPVAASLIAAIVCGPALAQSPAGAQRVAHPNGVVLTFASVKPLRDSVVVEVAIANSGEREIRLNRERGLTLKEDASGVHFLNPPADNLELRIPARSDVATRLVFIGPLAPATRHVILTTNQGVGTPDNPHDDTPVLRASLPVPGHPGGAGETQANHPNGAVLRVRAVVAGRTGCTVSLQVANGNDRTIRLNHDGGMVLTDAAGVVARLDPPDANAELAVPPGQLLDADLAFDCRNVDGGGMLTLHSNRGGVGTTDNPYDTLPVFNVPLRPARQPDSSGVGATSRASVRPIARSRIAAATTVAETAPAAIPAPEATAPEPPAAAPATPGTAAAPPPAAAQKPAPAAMAAPRPPALHVTSSERGLRVIISADTLFGAAGDTLQAEAMPLLGQLTNLISKSKPREIVIAGHTDSAGEDDDNLALSEQRARAVMAWLKARAPKPLPRYVERSYGRTRPLAPNHNPDGSPNPDGRERNRRIEVTLLRR